MSALKMEASSHRNNFLRCEHQLSLMQNVLQQHSIALRNLHARNPDVSSGIVPYGTPPNKVPYISTLLLFNEQTASNPVVNISAVPTGTPPQQTAPQQTAPQQTPPQQTPPQQTTPQATTTHMPMTSSSSPVNQRELRNDNS